MSAHGAASGPVGLDAVAKLPAVAQLPAAPELPRPHPLLATPRRVLKRRSDAALAERFRAGDHEAFAVLYERHRAGVIAVCIGVLGSRHDAEDAAQDAFSALAVALRTNPPRDLRAWLARVARNAAIDVIRRRRVVSEADENLEGEAPASTEVRAELESVLTGLRELPESQRTALLMRELGGHSYQEIGDLLELDESAVRGLIARARIGLRAHREATEMPCAAARQALATEPDGRHRDRTVRRHLRSCASCKAYGNELRRDARSLRGFVPAPIGGFAGGGAIFGGFAVKTALTGGVLSQVTAACAVSVCAVGGFALLYPHAVGHHDADRSSPRSALARAHAARASTRAPASAVTAPALRPAPSAPAAVAAPRSAGGTATPTLTPKRAAKVLSSASVVLTQPIQLPGSQRTSKPTPTGAPAGVSPAPTGPTTAPIRPVSPTPTMWGGSPTVSPTGGSGNPAGTFGGGDGTPSGYGGGGSPTGTPTGSGTGSGDDSGDSSGTAGGTGTGTGSGGGGGGGGDSVHAPSGYPSSGTGWSSSPFGSSGSGD